MKTISKKDIPSLLQQWSKDYEIYTPCRKRESEFIFDRFSEKEFTLDYGRPSMPPKWAYIPQNEIIFEIADETYRAVSRVQKRILFGIRACDMAGIVQSSSFMERNVTDPFFHERHSSTLTVVIACPSPPADSCFCTTTASGPWAEQGFDIQLFDAGDYYLIEEGSSQGSALLVGGYFGEAPQDEGQKLLSEFKQNAFAAIPELSEFKDAMDILKSGRADEEIWRRFGDKCIVCGGCAFVCPTCTCFNVTDCEFEKGSGLRIRSWDACLFNGFTQESSGHNPRPTQSSRIKRRHEHKLRYFNETDIRSNLCGCVGCGRCSDFCPVHIGSREVIVAITAG